MITRQEETELSSQGPVGYDPRWMLKNRTTITLDVQSEVANTEAEFTQEEITLYESILNQPDMTLGCAWMLRHIHIPTPGRYVTLEVQNWETYQTDPVYREKVRAEIREFGGVK